jgi:hypothetical protein
MIEEVSGESGPLSDREQQRRPPGEKENMAKRKCISEASIDSNDEDEEEDEYFDAPSTPKKLPLIGRNPVAQQSPRKIRNGGGGQTQTLSRNSAFTSQRRFAKYHLFYIIFCLVHQETCKRHYQLSVPKWPKNCVISATLSVELGNKNKV